MQIGPPSASSSASFKRADNIHGAWGCSVLLMYVACGPVRTLHVKDGVYLVVYETVVPYHPWRPADLPVCAVYAVCGMCGVGRDVRCEARGERGIRVAST